MLHNLKIMKYIYIFFYYEANRGFLTDFHLNKSNLRINYVILFKKKYKK